MNSVPSTSLATIPPQWTGEVAAPRTLQAARDFEASLIASLLESMEKTFASVPGDPTFAGADDYNYLGTQALASAIAARGGFGIAKLITRTLAPHEGTY
ncbi:MAG TPA: rod-binding protein [Candidatus Binatia bacterium]|nr:rod-binding protein [Candidatus Binatia bacterium]